jgi:hypothetical protein
MIARCWQPVVLAAAVGGCFSPEFPSGQPCAQGVEPSCPTGQVCYTDGFCYDRSDLPGTDGGGTDPDAMEMPRPDARPDARPGTPDAMPMGPDAALVQCDLLAQTGCDGVDTRCTLVALTFEPPYDAYIACVPNSGDRGLTDPCTYTTAGPSGGIYDNCAQGLVCDPEVGQCLQPCDPDQSGPGICSPAGAICVEVSDIPPELGSLGLCQLPVMEDAGMPGTADAGGPVPTAATHAPIAAHE